MKPKPLLVRILGGLLVVAAGFFALVSFQPSGFRVTRSATFAAPPEAIFPHVNDLKKWEAWSPWAKLDPNAKNTFAGPSAGKGAVMSWAGDSKVGEGRMTITESRTNEFVEFQLEFYKPMAGVSTTGFTFKPLGTQTEVTWTMAGRNNFSAKALCLFMNMDKMVGEQFEQGFANLKSVVESEAKR